MKRQDLLVIPSDYALRAECVKSEELFIHITRASTEWLSFEGRHTTNISST
jgi:hypothetical protein